MQLDLVLNDKEIMVDLVVESTVPLNDTYVVFSSLPTPCGLENGKNSTEYVRYYFRKVSHLCHCRYERDNIVVSLAIGFYFIDNEVKPFIIQQDGNNGNYNFSTNTMHGEQYYDFHKLFNYKEYCEVLRMLGREPLPFKNYIEEVMNLTLGHEPFNLFDPEPRNVADFKYERMVDNATMMGILDKQETLV